jgi:serine/threonine protein kinase
VSEAGAVVLADFGVAAARMRPVSMVNLQEQAGRAKTFVGTPCWMAPEVMQQSDLG